MNSVRLSVCFQSVSPLTVWLRPNFCKCAWISTPLIYIIATDSHYRDVPEHLLYIKLNLLHLSIIYRTYIKLRLHYCLWLIQFQTRLQLLYAFISIVWAIFCYITWCVEILQTIIRPHKRVYRLCHLRSVHWRPGANCLKCYVLNYICFLTNQYFRIIRDVSRTQTNSYTGLRKRSWIYCPLVMVIATIVFKLSLVLYFQIN